MRYLKLFECCYTVKGKNYTTILDPQREDFYRFPNRFYDVLELLKAHPYEEAKKKTVDQETFEEVSSFILDNELGFFTETPENFPPISRNFEEPFIISNAILDYNATSDYDLDLAIEQLETLSCPFIQFRFYDKISEKFLIELLDKIQEQDKVLAVEIIAKFNPEISLTHLDKIKTNYLKLQSIVFHSAPEDKLLSREVINHFSMMMVILSTDVIRDEKDCGKVSTDYFVTNDQQFILESYNYNNCLNKKVSVDKNGLIRNCPSMKKDYGHINQTDLAEVIEDEDFKKVWSISKDEVSVCQQCEFKLICSDCRAYTHDDDLYGKPEKCEYDPIAVL